MPAQLIPIRQLFPPPDTHHRTPDAGDVPYRTYREYLRHPRFLAVRALVMQRAAGQCEYHRCQRRATEVHHWRYPPWGTFDVPENMIAVCHACHCRIHGKAN
jgi:hypothetical protein